MRSPSIRGSVSGHDDVREMPTHWEDLPGARSRDAPGPPIGHPKVYESLKEDGVEVIEEIASWGETAV